jgi:hypothetical protein
MEKNKERVLKDKERCTELLTKANRELHHTPHQKL